MNRYLDSSTHSWASGVGFFALSVALHGTIIFSADHLMPEKGVWKETTPTMHYEKVDELQFEFVEAPAQPQIYAEKPKNTRKISTRDTLNQDLTQDKSKAEVLPQVKSTREGDQLFQRQGSAAIEARPKIEPVSAPQSTEPAVTPKEEALPEESVFQQAKEASIKPMETKDTEKIEPYMKSQNQQPTPRVEEQAASSGEGNGAKINTPESGKTQSKGAQLFGQTSFEATGSGMGAYMKNLKEKIWLAWFPYITFKYPQDFRTADAVIGFVLDKNGEVKIVQVVDANGSPLFASFCMEAIQKAGGFGPVPQEILALIGKDELELKFGFHYR